MKFYSLKLSLQKNLLITKGEKHDFLVLEAWQTLFDQEKLTPPIMRLL